MEIESEGRDRVPTLSHRQLDPSACIAPSPAAVTPPPTPLAKAPLYLRLGAVLGTTPKLIYVNIFLSLMHLHVLYQNVSTRLKAPCYFSLVNI